MPEERLELYLEDVSCLNCILKLNFGYIQPIIHNLVEIIGDIHFYIFPY